MTSGERRLQDGAELRIRAEAFVQEKLTLEPNDPAAMSSEDARQAFHELRVSQIELEMQNDELLRTQEELEAARARYFDLYNLAPVGYCTLSEKGIILEANLTAATLLGVARGALTGQPFTRFICQEDQDIYYLHHRQLVRSGEPRACELRMLKTGPTTFWAHLEVTVAQDAEGAPIYRITLSDITGRQQIEGVQAFLARTSSGTDAEPFFEVLARYLAQRLGMDFVCIDRLEGDGLSARTVAAWCDGKFEDNVTYALKDTPCGDVVGKMVCCFPASVCQFFPRDQVLQDLRAESYVGVTLFGHTGQPIGLIAVIGRSPLENRPLAEATLQMVAVRAAAELERLDAEAMLQTSEQRFQALVESAPIGIYFTDREGACTYVNRRWCEAAGISPEEAYGHGWVNGLHPEDRKTIAEKWTRSMQSDGLWGFDYRFQRRDGRVTWVNGTTAPLYTTDGTVEAYVGANIDITERKRAEEALAHDHAMLERTENIAHIGSWEWDVATDTVIWSEEMFRIFQRDPADGAPSFAEHPTFYPPKDMARLRCAVEAATSKGTPYELELHIIRTDGADRVCLARGDVKIGPGGKVLQLFGSFQDITERRQIEEALRASGEWHRTIIQTALSGYWLADMQGRLIEVNESYCQMSGYGEAELLSMHISDLDYDESPDETAAHIRKIVAQGWDRFENRHRRKDGSMLSVELSVKYRPEGDGRLVAFIRDITERKRAEEAKTQLQDQLLQSQKMESVGRLAGGVAHDFNNMLGVIIGHAEMALDQVDPALPLHDDLAEIRKAAERSADLTRQLLAFARKQTVMPKVLDLNATVAGMLKLLQRLIGEDIDLAWLPGDDLGSIKMDPSQIDQILANLCVNARDAIADVGKLTIETCNRSFDEEYCAHHPGFAPGDYVRLSISDNGCGMDRETLAQIFEPFFTTKGVGEGTGLGLATVYGAVKQNGGFINVYSEPGQGTTFTIYLPRHKGEAGQAPAADATDLLKRGHETILLVEDEPSILQLAKMILERQGYTVLTANTPGEAIRLAGEHADKIHLLITDVIMPGMNGRELAKNLMYIYPHLKLLFMSGYTADVIANHGVLDEGVFFIQKPFSIKDLAAKVREALDRE